jgi:hypothetical protein
MGNHPTFVKPLIEKESGTRVALFDQASPIRSFLNAICLKLAHRAAHQDSRKVWPKRNFTLVGS